MMITKEKIRMFRKMELMAINMMNRGCWPGAKAFYEGLFGFESFNDYINFISELGYFDSPRPAYFKRICR
jgi:hypothetical protein